MKIEKRTLKSCKELGCQLKVKDGRLVASDGTVPDMSEWSEGTEFFIVSKSTLIWLNDMQFIINHWSA